MNYGQSLNKAKTLLQQKHLAQAVQTAASALEHLLVELYNDVLNQSPPARQKQLVDTVAQVGGGSPLNKLTLGKLVNVYRASKVLDDLKKTLGLNLRVFSVEAIGPLVEIRNHAVHENREPDEAEAAYIVNQVELILRETGRMTVPPAQAPVSSELAPWWHLARPHQDIRENRLDLKVFAVDLALALEGDAVPEYRDAQTFFQYTYLTRGLQAVLKGVLRRLAGHDDGVAITQMATVFGGGKTHTLLALYHIVAHAREVVELEPVRLVMSQAEMDTLPQARVVAVDCAHISPSQPRVTDEGLTLHTLWGEIAYRLGGANLYNLIRQSDEQRIAPGSETLGEMFRLAGPSLILIDETLSYITKASGVPVGKGYLSDQSQEFLLELTRAVNAADNVALVLTMTDSEQEQIGESAMRAAQEIDRAIRILRRTRQVEVSAEREELYEILKRRLFETNPQQLEVQARTMAQAYWAYYRAHSSDFPQEAQTPEYRDLMIRAYPFHPALIELLRDRWGSISGFQRTRGVLRLLALVINDLYRRQQATPFIQPAHINLDNGAIRGELLEYVDKRGGFESAVFSDIGGTAESKAPNLDQRTGGDYARYRISTGLATSIFLYSHSGATDRAAAAGRPQLWLATLTPGILPALAADALDKLKNRLWYLSIHEGLYRIDSQPNLNQIMVSRIDAIRQEPDAIQQQIRTAMEGVLGDGLFAHQVLWPDDHNAVDDRRATNLIVLGTEQAWDQNEARQKAVQRFIEQIIANAKNTFRQFKNTLVFLLPTSDGVQMMQETAVRLLALDAIYRQYRSGGLTGTQMTELETELEKTRKGLPAVVWGAYTVVITPGGRGDGPMSLWVKQEHGFPGYRPGEHTLAGRVWKRLLDDQRLLERLDPRLISEGKGDQWRLWAAEDEQFNVAMLWDNFCRYPYLPMLSGPVALQQTIAWGVQRGLFAYALGDGQIFDTIRYQETRPAGEFAVIEGAWLLRPRLAEELLKPAEVEVPTPAPQPDPHVTGSQSDTAGAATGDTVNVAVTPSQTSNTVTPPAPRAVYRHLTIDTSIGWDQWYEFYRAVIQPLVESGTQVQLTLHLEATGELDVNLIDLSVRESVQQIGLDSHVDVS